MRVLLIDPDDATRSRLVARLNLNASDLTIATNEVEARRAFSSVPFTVAIVRYPLASQSSANEFEIQVQSHCHYAISLTDGSPSHIEQSYASGFVDCISEICGDEQLQAKLKHAEHLERLERRLAQAQKLESIGELTAGIAHEINTPIQYVGDNTRFVQDSFTELMSVLNTCQGLIAKAKNGDDISELQRQFTQFLEEADTEYLIEEIPSAIVQTLEGVDRVASIVRAMKEFAHPGVSEMVPTNIAKSIENTLMVARNEWKYVAEVNTELDPDLPPVWCLPGEVNQVLLNMIVNAAHAIGDFVGESSGVKGVIRITTQRRGANAAIRISDTGTGIRPQDLTKIFDPFFTTKKAGRGTGQGLAIAHSVIVEHHSGTISVESELGQGTTFVIEIPFEPIRHSTCAFSEVELATMKAT